MALSWKNLISRAFKAFDRELFCALLLSLAREGWVEKKYAHTNADRFFLLFIFISRYSTPPVTRSNSG